MELRRWRVLRRNFVFVSAAEPRGGDEVGWFSTDSSLGPRPRPQIRIRASGYRAVLSREVLAVYRRSPGSVSSSVTRQGANNLLTYERALRRGNSRHASGGSSVRRSATTARWS